MSQEKPQIFYSAKVERTPQREEDGAGMVSKTPWVEQEQVKPKAQGQVVGATGRGEVGSKQWVDRSLPKSAAPVRGVGSGKGGETVGKEWVDRSLPEPTPPKPIPPPRTGPPPLKTTAMAGRRELGEGQVREMRGVERVVFREVNKAKMIGFEFDSYKWEVKQEALCAGMHLWMVIGYASRWWQIGYFAGVVVLPVLLWAILKDRNRMVDRHGRVVLNRLILVFLVFLIGTVIGWILPREMESLVEFVMGVVTLVAAVVSVIGAMMAWSGQDDPFPQVYDFLDQKHYKSDE